MIALSRSGRAGRWSSPLSCQLRTEVGPYKMEDSPLAVRIIGCCIDERKNSLW